MGYVDRSGFLLAAIAGIRYKHRYSNGCESQTVQPLMINGQLCAS
jgi:hypothetical protein